MSSSESSKDRFAPLTFEQMYGVEEPEPDGRPLELEIDSLVPFPNQPFNPYTEDEMAKMVESIYMRNGISPFPSLSKPLFLYRRSGRRFSA